MAIWTIYNQAGSTVRATVKELEYHGEWMGDEYVSVTVRSAEPVQFSVGDKLEYRGETFEINYDPNLIKRARSRSYGEAFVYENVRLYSQASRLKDVGFKDYVLNWDSQSNTIPYSSQGTFQFFCGSVEDLADRIQANLDRHTNGLWKVFTPNSVRTSQRHNCGSLWSSYYDGTEDTGKTDVNIEADNLSCLDAVNLSYSAFSLSYYVTNATVSGSVKNIIVIGGAPVSAAHNFRYGKDNGLYEIERTSDDSERIVTKLFAYGSDKNLPLNYYANLGKEIHISIYHKSTREIILGQPDLLLWVNKEWTRSLGSAFAPNYSVTLTSGTLTYKVSVTHDHLNGYDNDRGPLVDGVDYMYFRLWSGDAGAQAFYDAVTAGQTFTVTGVSINKMPEEWIYQPPSYNYPALLSISRLMLPGFPGMSLYSWVASHGGTNLNPTTGRATWRGHTAIFSRDARDPWVMSERSATLGVREGTLNFDGSAGEDEVAPTIEGAVDGAGRRLDEVAWAEQMDDSGFLGEDPEEGLLTFGFMPGGDPDYIDWLDNDGDVTISMKDGACVGREFKMKKAEKNGNGDWELTLNRCYDDSLGRYFPYREEGSNTLFQVVGSGNTHGTMDGNHFVILGISMPGGLVEAASIRLLEKALEQLDKKDHQTFTYIPKIDEIYMQRQDDAVKEGRDAATYGTVSLHDTLHAGMQMEIQDSDLNIHYMPFIDVLTIRENGNNGIPTYDVVLRDEKELTMQQRIQSQIEGGTEAAINGVEDAYSSSRYLSKIQDDTAQGFIRFIKGLQVGERFVPGLMGEGGVFRKEADGTTYIEADNLYIRMKAYFDTVEIRKFLHTGGNRIATVAGAKCVRVEWRDNANNILTQEQSNLSLAVKFRCFFRANDGDNIVTNDFLVGDQAYCHVTRMQSETMEQASEGTGGSMLTTRHYWRLVIGTNVSDDGGRLTEDGEYWIDLSNYFYNGQPANMTWQAEGVTHNHLSHQAGSDIPMAQDDIVQLGHAYDTTRQGAIVEFVTGGDSPSYQIFQGIDEFSFVGKNYISLGYATGSTNTHGAGHAYMDLYGDVFIGAKPDAITGESPTYIKYEQEDPVTGEPKLTIKAIVEFQSPDDPQTTTTLDDFARLITGDIENIQSQIDGEIDTWFYAGIPTLQNAPANEWTTDAEKEKHTGDLYYDIGTGADAGKAYRFVRSQTTPYVYSWQYIDDTAITEALRIAAHAQDTADGKRRVFLTIPTPPYDEGDLWANAVYPANYDGRTDEGNHRYNNDLLRAKKAVPRTEDEQEITTFSINDWELASKYTDDSALLDFLDGYQGTLTTIRNQVDAKAETWYQDEDPSTLTPQEGGWYGGDDAEHEGDIWFCTKNHASPSMFKKGTTWIWKAHTTEHGVSYSWEEQEIPDEVFDKIDGKSSIYANDPNDVDSTKRHPSNYKANDVWILPMIYVNGVLNPSTYTINNIVYGAGEMLTALRDNETYSAGDWAKKVRYTDDSALENFKTNQYVQLLTGGQITSDINSAKQTAENAQTAAEAAQTSADNANTKLTDWASDSYISPTEKTALKTEWEDVKTEYTQICNDADKYSIDKTAFTSAYTSANAAFQKYTAATPENITVGSDYQNIKDYYAARQTILNAISDAAKTLAQNAATAYMSDTALNAIKYALNGGSTTQDGGLILSNIIALRDANQNVMSGMNGVYNSQLTSGGIAAWYGGAMTDHEQSPSVSNYAKSLFRFDGSGYLASGNITWDASGAVTIKNITTLSDSQNTNLLNELATFNSAFSFATSGSGSTTVLSITPNVPFTSLSILDTSVTPNVGRPVATQKWVSDNYISIAFFNRLFQAYSSTTISDANKVAANDTTTAINNLKLLVGTWTNEYLSALGLNSQQGGGGGGGDVYWSQLTTGTGGQSIHASLLTNVTKTLSIYYDENPIAITYNGKSTQGTPVLITRSYADARYLLASEGVKSVKYNNGSPITPDSNGVVDLGTISGGGGDISTCVQYGGIVDLGQHSPFSTITAYATSTNLPYGNKLVYNYNGDEYSILFSFRPNQINNYGTILKWGYASTYIYIARKYGGNWSSEDWQKTSAGYADTTGKLNTAVSIWGQSFDGSGNVSGRLSLVASDIYWKEAGYGDQFSIEPYFSGTDDANILCFKSATGGAGTSPDLSTKMVITGNSGNVGIGTNAPNSKLHVNGRIEGTGGMIVSGRAYNAGDDEGIVVNYDTSGYAALVLGSYNGRRSVFYINGGANGTTAPYWRYNSGSATFDILHPMKGGTIALTSDIPTSLPASDVYAWAKASTKPSYDLDEVSDGSTRKLSNYVLLAGDTMTGKLTVKAPILGYNYQGAGNNAAAFILDKPGANMTGIGSHTSNDVIWFGACNANGTWIDTYKQIWDFNGTIKQEGNAVIHAGNIGSQTVSSCTGNAGTATKLQTSRTIWGESFDGTGNITGNLMGAGGAIDMQYTDEINRYGGTLYIQHRGGQSTTGQGTGGTKTGNLVMCCNGGNVGIGMYSNLTDRLNVKGTIGVTGIADGGFRITSSDADENYMFGASTNGYIWGSVNGRYLSFSNGIVQVHKSYFANNTAHYFREPTAENWRGGMYWGTNGNEALCFVAKNVNTKFMFVNNSDIADWANNTHQSVTPLMSIGTNVGIGTQSPSTSLHVIGRVTCEYDSTKLGSFKAIRGDYATWYGINSTGFAMITTAQKDASSSTVRITMTPHTAQEQYIMFGMSSNFIMGTGISGSTSTYRDGAYIQIGGARIVWDNANTALKVVRSDGTSAANFYATGAVSALGANTSGGGGGGDVYWSQLTTGSGGQSIHGSLLTNVTKTLNIYYDENPVAISYNGKSTQGTPVLITRSYAEGRYVKQSGNATISGTATIGGYMTIGATVAVGAVNSQVIQTLNNRAIYIKTGNAPNYVDGTWSNTSDIRLKDIINNVGASVDQIANAPIFNYKWKAGGVSIMLGSSAQYWQKVFQYAVEIGPENYLYMDYSSVALASAVMVARKVQNHEDRIAYLERENENLRNRIKQLEAA